MAGAASIQLRSAYVVETASGVINTTPAFKTMHTPAIFEDTSTRFHQSSLVAGGRPLGDALLNNDVKGKINKAPLTYSHYDLWMESLFQGQFATDVLTDGFSRQTMTVENTLPAGIGGASTKLRYVGVEAVGGSIEVDAEGAVYAGFDLIGMFNQDSATSIVAGATYTDPVNNDPFSAQTDVGTITVAGFTLDAIASLKMDFNYVGRDPQPKIGSGLLAGVARGAFTPKITAKFYADTNFAAIRDIARQNTQSNFKITVNLGSVTLKKYKFEFWNCYADMSQMDFSGASAFVNVTFSPVYSASNSCIMTLTRALA